MSREDGYKNLVPMDQRSKDEARSLGQQGGIAIAETLYGMNNPTGKTPIQFPRDMASVNNQEGDVSFDLENPLYDYGWGLSYDE